MKLMLERDSDSGNKEVGGRENNGNLEGEIDEYLEEKTPVEIIEERKQRLHTSRMDTRLWTPALRRQRVGGWEKKTIWEVENNIVEKELRTDVAKTKRVEST